MLLRFMSEFLALMPTKLPDLLPRKTMEDAAVYDDYAQLTFHPKKKMSVNEVAELLEEQANLKLLYLHEASDGLNGWQSCCAFSVPNYKQMYKFNATANDHGYVDTFKVCIYDDHENMRGYLRKELKALRQQGGIIHYMMSDAELFKLFL